MAARSLQPRRTPATLLALFGAVALVLSAIGIYGVLSFAVAERVREFGIRQALGADRASILSLVLEQGLRTTAAGIALGLGGRVVLTRYLQSLLFGVSTRDAAVFGAATASSSPSRWWRATSRRAAPRGSIRWWRSGIAEAVSL